jgi:hypothetical protein
MRLLPRRSYATQLGGSSAGRAVVLGRGRPGGTARRAGLDDRVAEDGLAGVLADEDVAGRRGRHLVELCERRAEQPVGVLTMSRPARPADESANSPSETSLVVCSSVVECGHMRAQMR